MNNWIFTLLISVVLNFTLSSAAVAESTYYLGSGDKISINVYNEDMNVDVRLGASGSFRFPFLGLVVAQGKSIEQLENEITHKLEDGWLVAPQVRVRIDQYRPFYINGEVKNPGQYPYQQGLTLRTAISIAGGLSDNADEDKISLIRNGKNYKINIADKVSPGDIISIEKSFYYISGEVNSPGKFPFKVGLSIREAVSLAGGFTERASESSIVVLHEDGKGKDPIDIGLNGNVLVGDFITVKQSFF